MKMKEFQRRIKDSPWEGAPTLPEGVPTYDFSNICKKTHEIGKILDPGGGARRGCPLRSATKFGPQGGVTAPPPDPPMYELRNKQLTCVFVTIL